MGLNKKVSACLVVYNEARNIRRCLDSLTGAVNEIIIIHDGECQDKTLEIAREYTDKVFVEPHAGAMEINFIFALSQAQNDWVLHIDADEFLGLGLQKDLKTLINESADDISAYEFLWPLWNGQKRITKRWPYKRCLFRKSRIYYWGVPHFVATVKEGIVKKIINEKMVLEHQPEYNNFTWRSFMNKWRPWAKLQAELYLKDFKDIKKFNDNWTNWPRKIRWRIKYPLLFLPMEFTLTFFKNLAAGGWREFPAGFCYAGLYACYRGWLDYYIFKGKGRL
jgi:glycosyltransferase involved in cell wall biosynthesis